jgi:methionyl-tRNA synthetase
MDRYALSEGAAAAFGLVDRTNEFIAATAPWTLAADPANEGRLTQAVLLTPFMPASAAEILRRVGALPGPLVFERDARWRNHGERVLSQDGPLWPRSEQRVRPDHRTRPESAIDLGRHKERRVEQSTPPPAPSASVPSSTQASAPPAASDRISIDEFMRVELRVAKILEAERVPKSTKLLKLKVDVGVEQRTIVAGIAESYAPEALVGRTVVVVCNLKPAKLMGVESNGMVLAASPDGGMPVLLGFEAPPAPGTRVR